jgi:hypothetical protein
VLGVTAKGVRRNADWAGHRVLLLLCRFTGALRRGKNRESWPTRERAGKWSSQRCGQLRNVHVEMMGKERSMQRAKAGCNGFGKEPGIGDPRRRRVATRSVVHHIP